MSSRKFVLALASAVLLLAAAGQASTQQVVDEAADLSRIEANRNAALRAFLAKSSSLPTGIDVSYYKLDIRIIADPPVISGSLNPPTISGSVLTVARVIVPSITQVVFDVSSPMIVDSVKVDGLAPGSLTRTMSTLEVFTPRVYTQGQTISVQIYYHGSPSMSGGLGSFGAKILSDKMTPWYWTLSEPYGARDWWPCIDHQSDKADSLDVWITCAQPLTGVSQGKLVETVAHGDGTRTFKWRHRYPIATYLVSVTVSDFAFFADWYVSSPTDSMQIVNYVTPDLVKRDTLNNYRINASKTPAMMKIYSDLFGEYPFIGEKYGHVEFGWGGGMEHQTLTSLGTNAFTEGVISHELAHQWFGDMITCRTWPDLWLNEGFATYCEALYYEKAYGLNAYWSNMRWKMNNTSGGAKLAAGSLRLADTTDPNAMFNSRLVYNKGAAVLHMLRHVLGDSVFFAAMKAYATTPMLLYGTASTEDFRAVCEQVSGKDLGYFFSEWVLGQGYPHYEYSVTTVPDPAGFRTSVRVQQPIANLFPAFFTMPLDLRILGPGLDTTVTVFNDSSDQTFDLTSGIRPDSVQLDPQNWILRDVQLLTGVLAGHFVPGTVHLEQNFPNPFNPSTTIWYSLPSDMHVTLVVFDVLGRSVAALADGMQAAGLHAVTWNGAGRASGIYFYRLAAGNFVQTRSMVLMK